jgi:hypothetical protein
MRRRAVLHLGLISSVGWLIGCGSEGEGTIAPPSTKGNKGRLESLKTKAEMLKEKAAKPTKR